MLRAFADVVLVGTGTLLASPKGRWRPEGVYPEGKDAFARLRAQLGKPEHPAVAVVTSGASLDVAHPVLAEAVVLTTERGAAQLAGSLPDVVAVNDGDWVDLRARARRAACAWALARARRGRADDVRLAARERRSSTSCS